MSNDDFVHIIEFIPILLLFPGHITIQRIKLGSPWNCNVECLGRQKLGKVKQMPVVWIQQVRRHQRPSKTVEARHNGSGQSPRTVGRSVGITATRNTKSSQLVIPAMIAFASVTSILASLLIVTVVLKIIVIHWLRQGLVVIQPTSHKPLPRHPTHLRHHLHPYHHFQIPS